jgi:hypothetical protein
MMAGCGGKKKGYMGGGMVSPRKEMAMGGMVEGKKKKGYQMGGSVNPQNVGQAMQMGREIASAMAKPRADVTGMNAGAMDRTMGVQRPPMSSGRMRPQMRRNRLV